MYIEVGPWEPHNADRQSSGIFYKWRKCGLHHFYIVRSVHYDEVKKLVQHHQMHYSISFIYTNLRTFSYKHVLVF